MPTPPSANLSVTKSDSADPVQVGQELTYTIAVANAGPDLAAGATLTDSSRRTSPSCRRPDPLRTARRHGNDHVPAREIASNGSATVTIKVTPTTDGVVSNTASVSSSTGDPDTSNNSADPTTVVDAAPPPSADLSPTKSDSPDPVQLGQELTYTITVAVRANAAANATMNDTSPATVTFGSAAASQGSCSGTSAISCLGTIPAGGSTTVVVEVTPTTDADMTNTATASTTTIDSDPLNDSDTETTDVHRRHGPRVHESGPAATRSEARRRTR